MSITEIKPNENNAVAANAPFNFQGMFGQPAPGLCRIGANGKLAIRTKDGYKSFDAATGNLVNVGQFCLDAGAELFFIVPCNKVKAGDVILVKGSPRCVVKQENNEITAFNYETGNVDTIVPEKHLFMGNTYFYGKLVSPFLKGDKGGFKNILKFMMFSKLANGGSFGADANSLLPLLLLGGSEAKSMLPLMLLQQGGNGGLNGLLPLMLLSDGGVDNLFDGLVDGGFDGLFDDEEEKPKKKDAE
jgi:hypothetical protein